MPAPSSASPPLKSSSAPGTRILVSLSSISLSLNSAANLPGTRLQVSLSSIPPSINTAANLSAFYQYHVQFCFWNCCSLQPTGFSLQQFSQETFWGSLDQELCCSIFPAHSALFSKMCGAPLRPAFTCSIPPQNNSQPITHTSVLTHLDPAAKPTTSFSSITLPQGTDKKTHYVPRRPHHVSGSGRSRLSLAVSCSFCGSGHSWPAWPCSAISLLYMQKPPVCRQGSRCCFCCLLAEEVREEFMIGPFPQPSPFSHQSTGQCNQKIFWKKTHHCHYRFISISW